MPGQAVTVVRRMTLGHQHHPSAFDQCWLLLEDLGSRLGHKGTACLPASCASRRLAAAVKQLWQL